MESSQTDPIVILSDMSFSDVCYVLEYAYTGSLKISHDQLNHFLSVATKLQLKGVADFSFDVKQDVKEQEGEENLLKNLFENVQTKFNSARNLEKKPALPVSSLVSSKRVSRSKTLQKKESFDSNGALTTQKLTKRGLKPGSKRRLSLELSLKLTPVKSCKFCHLPFWKISTADNHQRYCMLNPNRSISRCPFCKELVKPGSMTYHKKTHHGYVPVANNRRTVPAQTVL